MTPWYWNAFHIIDPLWGQSIAHPYIPQKVPGMRSFDVPFIDSLNKQLNKQSVPGFDRDLRPRNVASLSIGLNANTFQTFRQGPYLKVICIAMTLHERRGVWNKYQLYLLFKTFILDQFITLACHSYLQNLYEDRFNDVLCKSQFPIWCWCAISMHGVMTWKRFSDCWSFLRGIHRSPDSPHNGPEIRSFVFPLVLGWTSCWTKSRFDGYLTWRLCHFNVLALVY